MEKKRITFSVPIDLYKLLKLDAERTGVPVTGMINIAIKEYVKAGSIIELSELYKQHMKDSK